MSSQRSSQSGKSAKYRLRSLSSCTYPVKVVFVSNVSTDHEASLETKGTELSNLEEQFNYVCQTRKIGIKGHQEVKDPEIGHGHYGDIYKVRMNIAPCIAKRVHYTLIGRGGQGPVGADQRAGTNSTEFHVWRGGQKAGPISKFQVRRGGQETVGTERRAGAISEFQGGQEPVGAGRRAGAISEFQGGQEPVGAGRRTGAISEFQGGQEPWRRAGAISEFQGGQEPVGAGAISEFQGGQEPGRRAGAISEFQVGRGGQEPVRAGKRAGAISKFQEECDILCSLHHPNVVKFVGVYYGHDKTEISLIMECMHVDLEHCMKTCPNIPTPLPYKSSILRDVANALRYLHPTPIIHCDVSASNMLLTKSLQAKIADLRKSKVFDRKVVMHTRTKVPGAQDFMPPEWFDESPKYYDKLDIFSFGHLAIYLTNQKSPLVADENITQEDVANGQVQISKRCESLGRMGDTHPLKSTADQCLGNNPDRRPTNTVLAEMYEQCSKQSNDRKGSVVQAKQTVGKGIQVDESKNSPPQFTTADINQMKSKLLEEMEQIRKMARVKDAQISDLEKELLKEKLRTSSVILKSSPVNKVVQPNIDMTPDFLYGMNVHGETVLEIVGDKPQKLEWPGYGFYIDVAEGALPPGVTASVTVKAIVGGQFQFPDNRQLISAIYCVSSNVLFQKEIAVNIEHCAVIKNEEDCSSFRFIVVSQSSQETLSYRFKEREGVFNPHTQFGTYKLKQFSLVGATAPAVTETHCTALMFYKQQMASPLVADFHFVIVKDLELFLQNVFDEYQGWSKDSHTLRVCFNGKTTLLLDQQEEVVDSWKILPLSSSKISNDNVSYFVPGRIIPHCAFELQLLPGKPLQRLLHQVDIAGVSSLNSFYIRYPQPENNKVLRTDRSSVGCVSLPLYYSTV